MLKLRCVLYFQRSILFMTRVAATLVLEGKGKKTITLRAICSGPELVKYNKKGCLDVTYYKYSGIVKEIVC